MHLYFKSFGWLAMLPRMQTRVVDVDTMDDSKQVVKDAVAILAGGGLVAVPTETVYGLAANALNAEAVAKVFEVKKRPAFDPLIVHLSTYRDLPKYCAVPQELQQLVDTLTRQFWPGPMTLVLPKQPIIPDIVTSGLDSVAVRISSHPTLRAIITACEFPLAAPSANLFGRISPTSARAVQSELDGAIELIINAGACSEGLESTILRPYLDANGQPAVEILRAGPITREQLKKFCKVRIAGKNKKNADRSVQAPGQLESHYAPKKPFILLESPEDFKALEGRLALISFEGDPEAGYVELHPWSQVVALSPGSGRMAEAAVRLFAVMRQLDEDPSVDAIYAEPVREIGLGMALMDRMRRASHPNKQA